MSDPWATGYLPRHLDGLARHDDPSRADDPPPVHPCRHITVGRHRQFHGDDYLENLLRDQAERNPYTGPPLPGLGPHEYRPEVDQ